MGGGFPPLMIYAKIGRIKKHSPKLRGEGFFLAPCGLNPSKYLFKGSLTEDLKNKT